MSQSQSKIPSMAQLVASLVALIAICTVPTTALGAQERFGMEPAAIVAMDGVGYVVGRSVEMGVTLFRTDATSTGTRAIASVPCASKRPSAVRIGRVGSRLGVFCTGKTARAWTLDETDRLVPLAPSELARLGALRQVTFSAGQALMVAATRDRPSNYLIDGSANVRRVAALDGAATELRGTTPDGAFFAVAGMQLVRIEPGTGASTPLSTVEGATLTVSADGARYFALDASYTMTPWFSDGTPAGTRSIVDFGVGKELPFPEDMPGVVKDGTWYVQLKSDEPGKGRRTRIVWRITPDGRADPVGTPPDAGGVRTYISLVLGVVDDRVIFLEYAGNGRYRVLTTPLGETEAIDTGATVGFGARAVAIDHGLLGMDYFGALERTDGTLAGTLKLGMLSMPPRGEGPAGYVAPTRIGDRVVFGSFAPATLDLELAVIDPNAPMPRVGWLSWPARFGTVEPTVDVETTRTGRHYGVHGELDFAQQNYLGEKVCGGSARILVSRSGRIVARARSAVRWTGKCEFTARFTVPRGKAGQKAKPLSAVITTSGAAHGAGTVLKVPLRSAR